MANTPPPDVLKNNLLVVDALMVISDVPSNGIEFIFLEFANASAVAALPEVLEALFGISDAVKARYWTAPAAPEMGPAKK